MKKFLYLFLIGIFSVALWSCSDDDDDWQPISFNKLPDKAQSYINGYCGGMTVKSVEMDDDGYEVVLTDGLRIDFDFSGEWTEVESVRNLAVPSGFVPVAIQNYIGVNYPNANVTEISREPYGYKVELNTAVSGDLRFDQAGNLINGPTR